MNERNVPQERMDDLGGRLLLCVRNELYSRFPFLDGAFAELPCRASVQTASFGTDGTGLLYNSKFLIRLYEKSPQCLRRGYLHTLLHCLYLHPFREKDRSDWRWNLACDMSAEQILEREGLNAEENPTRRLCLEWLGAQPCSAEEIYGRLIIGPLPASADAMERAFCADDHGLWKYADERTKQKWEKILAYAGRSRRRNSRRAGRQSGNDEEKIEALRRSDCDYRKYLQKFTVLKEEPELDMDSFDYIYYHYGMEHYGNLPLIEPLEYREGQKLEELVIAIDTSGSCSKETVRRFLEETYAILSRRENFFRRMKVVLIQCDCVIQSAVVIHSEEEWKNYSRSVTVQGRGGTDFTPVFRFVEEKRQSGLLKNLKALLYFTDGDGYYPREKTQYETAFVFLKESEHMDAVPSWAKVLKIGDGRKR